MIKPHRTLPIASRRVPCHGGYVVMYGLLLFIAISSLLIFGVLGPVMSSRAATHALISSKQAFLAANSAAEESLYRLKRGLDLGSSASVPLEGATATMSVADTGNGKIITVTATAGDYERTVRLSVTQSVGTSFHYGLQAGQGGFEMSGSSGIQGNAYSNGNIIGGGSSFITGSATAANKSDPVAHQANGSGTAPSHDILFGGQLTSNDKKPEDVAQSFTVSTTTPVSSVRLHLKKYANVWMNNITVRITNNASGKPGGTTLASGELGANQITTSYNYLSVPFSSNPVLTPGTTYWIVLDTANTWNSYYSLGANADGYPSGAARTGEWNSSNGGTWNNTAPAGLDGFFEVFVGGQTSRIDATSWQGIIIGGDAWARDVNQAQVTGTIYCQGSFNNNKPCNTSRPDPVQLPFPVSDGNIEAWKAEAAAGGETVGNVSYGGSGQFSIGPRKIVGDLTVGGSAQLTVNGTLWVTGNITVEGSGIIKLAGSYGTSTGVIVTDGRVTGGGSAKYNGNGLPGSYLLLVTTSACPNATGCNGNPAIRIDGSAGSVILNAQRGRLTFSGSAYAKQATADHIVMTGSTIVQYESGLANLNFSSGPSGAWNLTSWEEL